MGLLKPLQLGKLGYYHYTTPAERAILRGIAVFRQMWGSRGGGVRALALTRDDSSILLERRVLDHIHVERRDSVRVR